MSKASNHIRLAGGIFLEMLMIVFIVASSWSHIQHTPSTQGNDFVLSAGQVEEFAFIESTSSSEVLISSLAKASYIAIETMHHSKARTPALSIRDVEALQISTSYYNTFYTYLTAKAP